MYSVLVSHSVMPDPLRPHGLQPNQGPLSMEFSRQEYWNGLPFPSPRGLPDAGINPGLLNCLQILYRLELPGRPDQFLDLTRNLQIVQGKEECIKHHHSNVVSKIQMWEFF